MNAPPRYLDDLEPSLIEGRTYASRLRDGRISAALLLSVMIALLTLIPARLVLPGLAEASDAGRPALIVCLLMSFWWILARLNPRLALTGPQPLRWVVLAYLLSMLISYAAGALRGLTSMEANSADRWLLASAAFAGVILTAADGPPNWQRLTDVLRVFVWCSAFMAFVGLLQWIFRLDLAQYLMVPGLDAIGKGPDLQIRGSEVRATATASHYIELSVVLAIALPFALHFARFAAERRSRQVFTLLALMLAAGNLATISRTGIVALLLAAIVMFPTWPWRLRYNLMCVGVVMAAALVVLRPSLARTLLNLFLGAAEDNSIISRTERYEMVGHYFVKSPWLGRGTGTWIPPQYQFLDNHWLATALMNGIVGVVALAALHITAITLAVLALRRSDLPEIRHLCAALVATQAICIFAAAVFDSLWYSTYSIILALMTGVCGAVWRLTHPERAVRTSLPAGTD